MVRLGTGLWAGIWLLILRARLWLLRTWLTILRHLLARIWLARLRTAVGWLWLVLRTWLHRLRSRIWLATREWSDWCWTGSRLRLLCGLSGLSGLSILGSDGQHLRRVLLNFALQFFEFLVHNILIIRKVRFQPLEGALVIIGIDKLFEFVELFVAHLVGQTDTDIHLQFFINLAQE